MARDACESLQRHVWQFTSHRAKRRLARRLGRHRRSNATHGQRKARNLRRTPGVHARCSEEQRGEGAQHDSDVVSKKIPNKASRSQSLGSFTSSSNLKTTHSYPSGSITLIIHAANTGQHGQRFSHDHRSGANVKRRPRSTLLSQLNTTSPFHIGRNGAPLRAGSRAPSETLDSAGCPAHGRQPLKFYMKKPLNQSASHDRTMSSSPGLLLWGGLTTCLSSHSFHIHS